MPFTDPPPPLTLFTVGHSNHGLREFLDLLAAHRIDAIVDVRSSPYARYTPYFNKDGLQQMLPARGVRYVFLGGDLGGRPDGAEFYDAEGFVLYDRVARSPRFLAGIDRLLETARRHRVAVMCGEEDPANCHRRLLLARVLAGRGAVVWHIRGDGTLESEEQICRRETSKQNDGGQLALFETHEAPAWKSTQSVLGKKRRSSFSERSEGRPSNG